jgi:UDP-N-acetylmuramate dehydrogenase
MSFQRNVPLASYTNFRIGGPAKYFCDAKTVDQLLSAINEARQLNEPIFILGGGFNLLVGDKGFNGAVIKPDIQHLTVNDSLVVRAGAGVLISTLLDFFVEHELADWEWAGGLPGTLGGALWGNAGAHGGETKDLVLQVKSVNMDTLEIITRSKDECAFGYRSSVFKTSARNEVILEAAFQMRKGSRQELEDSINQKKAHREQRHPLEYPNAGSIFKNVPVERVPATVLEPFKHKIKNDPFPVLPTAVLTAAAGLKGFRIGDAQVSEKHSNFIVNLGGATAAQVKEVMMHIKKTIKEKFDIDLEQEIIFVGE